MTVPRRRWFRFSLRTLFVVVTVLCAVGAWLSYHLNWIRERRAGAEWLKSHHVIANGGGIPIETRPGIPWSLAALGEKPAGKVLFILARDDEPGDFAAYRRRVAEIAKLFPESQIVDLQWVDPQDKLGTHADRP